MTTLDTKPSPSPEIISRIVDNEAVLVLPEHGKVKVLNEVGTRIWELTDGRHTIREIAAQICSEYAINLQEAEADALEFFTQLAQREIVILDD